MRYTVYSTTLNYAILSFLQYRKLHYISFSRVLNKLRYKILCQLFVFGRLNYIVIRCFEVH